MGKHIINVSYWMGLASAVIRSGLVRTERAWNVGSSGGDARSNYLVHEFL